MSNKITVEIPSEDNELMELQGAGLPALCLVNKSLVEFKHKNVFSWHCSMTFDLQEFQDNGMPSDEERDALNAFFDRIDPLIKANNNAVWLARVTWNKTQELIWRVINPEAANDVFQAIIESEDHPLPFDYRIEPDSEWGATSWLLDPVRK